MFLWSPIKSWSCRSEKKRGKRGKKRGEIHINLEFCKLVLFGEKREGTGWSNNHWFSKLHNTRNTRNIFDVKPEIFLFTAQAQATLIKCQIQPQILGTLCVNILFYQKKISWLLYLALIQAETDQTKSG